MTGPRLERTNGSGIVAGDVLPGLSVGEQYELLLTTLARAERDLTATDASGRSPHLEAASAIVFDLLYALDYKRGGELVPRLAALYGYVANELLAIGRSRDKAQLSHLRDMIATLKRSWYGGETDKSGQSILGASGA